VEIAKFNMSLKLVQYFVHDILINGTAVGGVQNVNISRNLDVNRIIKRGDPTTVKNFYREPNVDISFTKFISDTIGPAFTSFSLTQTPPQSFNLQMAIVDTNGLHGLQFDDCLLKSAAYSFKNEGFFTEQLTFNGRLTESGPTGIYSGTTGQQGNVRRRQNYNKSAATNPAEVTSILQGGSAALLSIEASFSANYGQVPTYGNFYTTRNKILTYPVDISCTYEILDIGYAQPYSSSGTAVKISDTLSYNTINDIVNLQQIVINGYPVINLGSNNFLTGLDRSGGDAGQGNYSIYKLTYKNNDGSFTIS
jgi:hypothetical protein